MYLNICLEKQLKNGLKNLENLEIVKINPADTLIVFLIKGLIVLCFCLYFKI